MAKVPEARNSAHGAREQRGAHAPQKPLPALVFRQLPPNESLLALAREQDALLRGVVAMDAIPSEVVIEKLSQPGRRFRAEVTSHTRGTLRQGTAEHERADWAVRLAYTELLRRTFDQAGGNAAGELKMAPARAA